MKNLTLAVIMILVLAPTALAEEKTYFKQSNMDSRKTVIYEYNPNGQDKEAGYLRRSVLDPRKTIVYDKDGEPQGYLRKSILDPRKIELKKD